MASFFIKGKELASKDAILNMISQRSIPSAQGSASTTQGPTIPITQVDPSYDLFVPDTTQLMMCPTQPSRFKNEPKDIAQWPYFFVLYLMMSTDTGIAFLVTVSGDVARSCKANNKWGAWEKVS